MKGSPSGGDLRWFVSGCLREKGCSGEDFSLEPMAGDGSVRNFLRAVDPDGRSLGVAMENAPLDEAAAKENRAYLMIGRHLGEGGIPVPEIYGADLKSGRFFMEDLGRDSLQDLILKGVDPQELYEPVLDVLFHLQLEGAKGFDSGWCCQTRTYDREVMRRNESDYFRRAFLVGYLGHKEDLSGLDSCFDYLAEKASEASCIFFMHRDFQSRNIIMNEGRVGIVDWQGGRLGPLGYDLASLLIDPYTALEEETKKQLYASYRRRLNERNPLLASELDKTYIYLALQRNLQILGAFAFLTRVRQKPHFEQYIPQALRSLEGLIDKVGEKEFQLLRALCVRIA